MTGNYVEIKSSTNIGWECPKCNRIYSPHVTMCILCSKTDQSDKDEKIKLKKGMRRLNYATSDISLDLLKKHLGKKNGAGYKYVYRLGSGWSANAWYKGKSAYLGMYKSRIQAAKVVYQYFVNKGIIK